MWTAPDPSLRPYEFKLTMGKCKEEFKGSEQQDAQEFLTFLIDGLHEEVNLVRKKGYFVFPELNGREAPDVATECWSINLLRNWSLFSFLFTGQLGSELTCKGCNSKSWSFEPFMSLSLPITTTQLVPLNVTIIPYVHRGLATVALGSVADGKEYDAGRKRPITVTLMVSKSDKVEVLVRQIYQLKNTGLVPAGPYTELVLGCVWTSGWKLQQIFSPATKLDTLEPYSASRELFAFEVPTNTGRAHAASKEGEIDEDTEERTVPAITVDMQDKYSLFNRGPAVAVSHGPKGGSDKPREFFAHVVNRTIVHNPKYLWKKYEPRPDGNPTLLPLNTEITNVELYDRAWEAVSRYLPERSKYYSYTELWWHQPAKKRDNKRPFILRVTTSAGDSCSRCSWRSQCLGCLIPPDKNKITLDPNEYLAIDWYIDVFQDEYQLMKEVAQHPSVEEVKQQLAKPISIYEIISKFTSAEELSATRCSACKKTDQATKRLTILRLPTILIIHLKRYKEKY